MLEYYTRSTVTLRVVEGQPKGPIRFSIWNMHNYFINDRIVGKAKLISRVNKDADLHMVVVSVYRYWKPQRWLKSLIEYMAR